MNCPSRLELLEAVNGTSDSPRVREHVAACAACRAATDGMMSATEVFSRTPLAPSGSCLSEADLAAYARRSAPAGREGALEEHLASCASCREEVVALVEALEARPDELPESLERRAIALGRPQGARRPATRRFARKRVPAFVWAAAAAAALFFIVILTLPGPKPPPPAAMQKPAAPPKREEPRPQPETPRPEPPRTEVARPPAPPPEPPRKEEPKPVVRAEPPKVEPKAEPRKEDPKPSPPPEPPRTEVAAPRIVPLNVLSVAGALSRRTAAGIEKVARPFSLGRGEELFTDARRPARFTAEGGVTGFLKPGTALAVERREDGELRVTLKSGAAYFAVDQRDSPFIVAAPHAEAVVVGTAFQLAADEKSSALVVSEGSVRFRNEKGEVLVKAGQRSAARAKERPSAPVRSDAAAEIAWTKRPDLSGDPKAELWVEHAAGANRKLAGLVVAAPYADWETTGGALAPAVAERLDAGVLLGHNHRYGLPKVYLNLDRGSEHEVREDGTRGPAAVTERSKAAFADYLAQMRQAAGVGPKDPVPMVLCLRVHSEKHAGADLEVGEVAWTGWNRKTIEQLKVLYAQLLDKHRPAVRFDLKFEGIDATYELRGQKRTFLFTESDAEGDGYMAPRNATNAMAIFFPLAFSRSTDGYDAYAKILAEMAEFLYANRRR